MVETADRQASGQGVTGRREKPSWCDSGPVSMKAKLIQIGDSSGVRIPKAFLKRAKLRNSQVVIRAAAKHPRAGWDDRLLVAAAD